MWVNRTNRYREVRAFRSPIVDIVRLWGGWKYAKQRWGATEFLVQQEILGIHITLSHLQSIRPPRYNHSKEGDISIMEWGPL